MLRIHGVELPDSDGGAIGWYLTQLKLCVYLRVIVDSITAAVIRKALLRRLSSM